MSSRLRKHLRHKMMLPSSHMLSNGLDKSGNTPVASGGFADVWKGSYYDRIVAIKALRIYNNDDLRKFKRWA